MGHTRGGGIGNRAGSYDHTPEEVEAEIRQRILDGGGYGDITEDELNRLVDHWRPIDEAPVPGPREGFIFICLLQTERGIVGEGCARYVRLRSRGEKLGELVLRWYLGTNGKDARVCPDPKYFKSLPAKRED